MFGYTADHPVDVQFLLMFPETEGEGDFLPACGLNNSRTVFGLPDSCSCSNNNFLCTVYSFRLSSSPIESVSVEDVAKGINLGCKG